MRHGPNHKTNTFNSWKEIALYLGRGVRTVQRWEAELQLPVHRFGRSERSPVFAFKAELDSWLRKQAGTSTPRAETPAHPQRSDHGRKRLTTLDRSARLTSKALQLIETQQAHARKITEQVQKMASLLPAARKVATERRVLPESSHSPTLPQNGHNGAGPQSAGS